MRVSISVMFVVNFEVNSFIRRLGLEILRKSVVETL